MGREPGSLGDVTALVVTLSRPRKSGHQYRRALGSVISGFEGRAVKAPDRIAWELGVRPGRPPLLPLAGDRYVTTAMTESKS